MSFQDRTVTCVDCGSEFIFTAGEQSFYQERGFDHPPRRCKNCRAARKGGGEGGGGGGRGGGRSSDYGGGPPRGGGGGGGRDRGSAREMYDAICSACGGPARLPFQPAADRPVYCRNCFQGRSGPSGSRPA